VNKVVSTVDRPNIALCMEKLGDYQEKQSRLIELVHQLQSPGIIYFSSKKVAEQIALLLKESGIRKVMAYHGGMDQEQRILIQQQFIQGQLDVICATSAFGMGVNKDNIRFIIHYHMPMQLESYLQEIGRAGRDGKSSIALLLNCPGDEQLPLQLMQRELPAEQQIDWLFDRLAINENAFILDEGLMQLGGFSETQWRIVEEFTGRIDAKIDDLETVKQNIKEYVLKRIEVKRDNLFQVIKWIDSDDCKRDFILNYFEEEANRNVDNCCDRCGIEFTHYERKDEEILPEVNHEHWIDYLAKILLV
jgi:ATP-dependent DNA helicase RecQ